MIHPVAEEAENLVGWLVCLADCFLLLTRWVGFTWQEVEGRMGQLFTEPERRGDLWSSLFGKALQIFVTFT